jgi:RNA polymerase sigma factor for flagellar operon FliA
LDDLAVASEAEWEAVHQKFTQNVYNDPLSFVESKDLVNKLAGAVAGLPERERMVVTLYYHEELTLREIGEIFDLSEGRICQIFVQAVRRLRRTLDVAAKPKNGSSTKRSADVHKPQSSMKPVRV